MSDIDDRIKSEALNWLVGLRGTAERAQGFALDQAPDVLREIVMLGRVQATAWLVIAATAVIVGAWWVRGFSEIDWDADKPRHGDVNRFIRAAFGMVFALFGPFIFFANLGDALRVWLAPKLYLIEQITDLIRRVG